MSVLLGNGKGGFDPITAALGTGQTPTFAAGGDFNGDKKPDLVTVNYDSNTFSVFLNQSK